jgi:hypothetical protein
MVDRVKEWQFQYAVLREEGCGFAAVGDDGEKVKQKCLGVGYGALFLKSRRALIRSS